MTVKSTIAAIRALSPVLNVRHEDGEYRVTIQVSAIFTRNPEVGHQVAKDRSEELAYYTNDGDDALGTAKAMLARWEAPEAPKVLTKPNTAHYAPLGDPERRAAYQADVKAWEEQRDTAAPYWSPYTGEAGAYAKAWDEAKSWEGKQARVTMADGTTRQGMVRLSTGNAPNGQAGIAVVIYDGFQDHWCGSGFLAIEPIDAPKPYPAPKAPSPALQALKDNVTGAIERGEAEAIVAVEAPAVTPCLVMLLEETGEVLARIGWQAGRGYIVEHGGDEVVASTIDMALKWLAATGDTRPIIMVGPNEHNALVAEYARLDDYRLRERLNWGQTNRPAGDPEVLVAMQELARRKTDAEAA